MFEGNELEQLALRARKQLNQQVEENTEVAVSPTEDLYAEFREDAVVNTDTRSVNMTGENPTVSNKPNEYIDNPTIPNKPAEGEEEPTMPELFPYDEPIFPDGPTKTQIDSWKKQWLDYSIYAVEIMEQYFVFRTLNRFEYKQLVALPNVDPLQREEIICETVTLWPREYKWNAMATEKAGIPSTFAQIIMDKSGFTKEYSIQVL